MIGLVFVIAALSAAIGYMAAVVFNHRQMSAEREDHKLSQELDRKELTEFMQNVQGIASNVDEKVDQHSLSLTAINLNMAETLPTDRKAVLQAVKQLVEATRSCMAS